MMFHGPSGEALDYFSTIGTSNFTLMLNEVIRWLTLVLLGLRDFNCLQESQVTRWLNFSIIRLRDFVPVLS